MDTMEVNKIVASVLVAGIAFFVTGMIGDGLVHETQPTETAIKIEGAPVGLKVRVVAWHERLGYLEGNNGKPITLKKGDNEVNFEAQPK